MRSGHCRPVLQFTAVVLCAAVAVGAWAAQETRGRTQALTLGLAFQRWESSVRAIQAIAGHRDRAAVLHLAAVPSTLVDAPLPETPLVPARDGAQKH